MADTANSLLTEILDFLDTPVNLANGASTLVVNNNFSQYPASLFNSDLLVIKIVSVENLAFIPFSFRPPDG